jgi:hypothetical protein
MDRTGDLEAALSFVVGRIVEQARLSGERLSQEQRFLLDNLPSAPASGHSLASGHPEIVELVPRDINYERLCSLAKSAYLNDREINPASLDWEFAFAIFALERHPMWGLLHWAGVRTYQRSSRDGLLLLIAGLLPVLVVILLASNSASKAAWSLFKVAGIVCGSAAIMFFIFRASQLVKRRQMQNHLERCRLASRFVE